MQIQINTDKHIAATDRIREYVEDALQQSLSRFEDRITRVEVQLTDENSSEKSSDDDKRCLLEARLSGLQPIAVSHQAATVEQAVDGAAEKLEKVLNRTLDRKHAPKGRTSFGGEQT